MSDYLPAQTARRLFAVQTGIEVPRSSWYRYIACGRIQSVRMGGRVLVTRVELERMISRLAESGEPLSV